MRKECMRCSLEVNSRKHVSIENKQHQHQLKGWVTATQPLNWPKDSQKHDLDPWDSSQVSRSKVAIEQVRFRNELYKLAPRLVKTTLISMNWARSPQWGTWWTGPLTRENYAQKYDLAKWSATDHLFNWPSDSWKLRSKVWSDQCAHSGHTKDSHFWWRLWWRLNACNIVVDIKSIR